MESIHNLLNTDAFTYAGQAVSWGQLLLVLGGIALILVAGYLVRRFGLGYYFTKDEGTPEERRRIRRLLNVVLFLCVILLLVTSLPFDASLSSVPDSFLYKISWSTLIKALLIYYIARLFDETLSDLLTKRYQQRRAQQLLEGNIYGISNDAGSRIKVSYIVQPIVYLIAAMFIIQQLGFDREIPLPWTKNDDTPVFVNQVLTAGLILLFTRLFLWVLTEILLYPYYRQKEINLGSQYAINRLLTYFVFVMAVVATLQYLGINLTVLLGGAAALLVGIGLGLQQTFNDLICGIILLFERTVELGDVVEIEGLVGTVRKIGIRTSLVETRDNVSVLVPNSKLVADNVINWSHFDAKTRFRINVGVAYGSDTALVKEILEKVANQHKAVVRRPKPIVRFVNFGDSSLDFEILFWSRSLIEIEDVKSDMRFEIDRMFREAGISIPFPQRDVWLRKEE